MATNILFSSCVRGMPSRIQNKDREDIDVLLCAYNTEKLLREHLQDEMRTVQGKLHIVLEQKQFLAGTDVNQIKQQLEALGNDVVCGKQHHEQLQEILRMVKGQVQELQSGDDFEQLKQKLAELTNLLTTVVRHGEHLQEELRGAVAKFQNVEQQQRVEKRDRQRLQEEVRIADGKIQALEQELEAHKNGCASAQAECVTERARGIEALNMQGGVLHNYIGRLQSSVARVQGNQADLEEQLRRLEIERGFHGQGL